MKQKYFGAKGMRRAILAVALSCGMVAFLPSCHRELSPSQAAEEYYGYLIDGNVEAYVSHLHDYNQLDEAYRSQLCDMFRQYLDREQQLRGGLVAAKAVRDTLIDSLQAQVFVDLHFGDSTHEQVSLPLVRTPNGWRLK